MQTRAIVREALNQCIKKDLSIHKIIYIGATIGWGKQSAVTEYLNDCKQSYLRLSADDPELLQKMATSKKELIIIEKLEILPVESQQLFRNHIADTMEPHSYIITGRSLFPQWLKFFWASGNISYYGEEQLRLNASETCAWLAEEVPFLKEPELKLVYEMTQGYPLAVSVATAEIARNNALTESTREKVMIHVYDCIESEAFLRFDKRMQMFLLYIAPFPIFTVSFAGYICNQSQIGTLIRSITDRAGFFKPLDIDTYQTKEFFREFLMWKQKELLKPEEICKIYNLAAEYYEHGNDTVMALEYYAKAQNTEAIFMLLQENVKSHPGAGELYETRKYYYLLPEEVIMRSPLLISRMSLLKSMQCKVEESELWYQRLLAFKQSTQKQEEDYWEACRQKIFLDISLGSRGSRNIITILKETAQFVRQNSLQLPNFSATSNLPSILNGGKDFRVMIHSAQKMYYIMQKPLELILGEAGQGLIDIAMGEALVEQKTSDQKAMSYINQGMMLAGVQGNIELEFVAASLIARTMYSDGNAEEAQRYLNSFRKKVMKKEPQLIQNLTTLQVKIDFQSGGKQKIDDWMKEETPDETQQFQIMERYRYLLKIRGYLYQEQYTKAICLLEQMIAYTEIFDRELIRMELNMLYAMVMYAMKDDGWRAYLQQSIEKAMKYGYVRMFAEEGAAILPLLRQLKSDSYIEKLVEEAKGIAAYYPDYLSRAEAIPDPLTNMERNVLRLISKGRTNEEIATVLSISIRTVKFHASNIYEKLGVKNRTQAAKAAAEKKLV